MTAATSSCPTIRSWCSRPSSFPTWPQKVGDDIITASGTTLLGADDKAGVAIIMAMARHLLQNPELPHGPIRVCFTPDEEIGRGVHADLPSDLGADVAYTLDGAELGEIVYETFSADKAVVRSRACRPTPARPRTCWSTRCTWPRRSSMTLPHVTLTPETTADRQGFIHVYQMSGDGGRGRAALHPARFRAGGAASPRGVAAAGLRAVQATEPRARITCTITPQYRNMRYWLENDMRPVELARQACRQLGIEPFSTPTRGGTDGSRLTEMGVPTPNLFTGMQNIHGPLEWISVQDMVRATEMCIELAQLWGRRTDRPRRSGPDFSPIDTANTMAVISGSEAPMDDARNTTW